MRNVIKLLLNRKTYYLSVFLLLICFTPKIANCQSSANYTFNTSTTASLTLDANSNAIDMSSGTTTLIVASSDQGVSAVTNIGFNFVLMGNIYSQFSASANGIIQLGASVVSGSTYVASGGTSVSPKLSAFGGDLQTGSSGKVHSKIIGNAPNRCLVIEFNNMNLYYTFGIFGNDATYQVRLYETSGLIEYVYGTVSVSTISGSPSDFSPSIGFSTNSTANNLIAVAISTNSSTTTSPFTENPNSVVGPIANLTSASDGNRRLYSFTPPAAPADPTTLTFSSVTATTTTVNFVDNSTNETGFIVQRATDAGFASNLVNTPVATTTSAGTGTSYLSIQTGLNPSTTYFYRILAVNEGRASAGLTGSQATNAAAVYIWNATTGSASWATPASWTPTRTTPDNSDILQFSNGGSSTATSIPTQTVGRISVSNNTIINLQSAATATLTIASDGTVANELSIEAGSSLINNSTFALTLTYSGTGSTGNIAGTMEVTSPTGTIVNAFNFSGGTTPVTTVAVGGILANGQSGGTGVPTITSTATNLIINGTYNHKFVTQSGTIPTATWNVASLCSVTGYTAASLVPTGLGQTFGNFTWNCTGQGTNNYNLALTSTTFNVAGTLSVLSTGSTGSLRLGGTGAYSANIGSIIVSGGTLDLQSGASGTPSLNISGSLTQTSPGILLSSATSTGNPTLHFNGTATQAITFATQPTGPITYRISNPNGITLTGPNANFNLGNGTLGGLRISTLAATPVTFAGTSTAFAYNAANSSLIYDAAGSVTSTLTEFPSTSGPAILTVNVGAANVLTIPFSRSITGTLTMTSGDINLSSNALTLGSSATAAGTLTWTSGSIRVTNGTLTRWFPTSGLPTTAGTSIGYFPLANGLNNRNVSIFFSTATALSTGGTITLGHTSVSGLTGVTPFLDGAYNVDTRTNSFWDVNTGNGITASGTIGIRITGGNSLFSGTPANLRVMQASSAVGAHVSGGGSSPNFQASRSGLTLAQIASSHYIGAGSPDIQVVYNSIASGDWNSPSTWDAAAVPVCTGVVNIINGHNVTVNSAANEARNVTVNTGGTLTIASGVLTVGCTLNNNTITNNGTLTVSGGTLNVNGNMISNSGSTFNQSGGNINIDGNSGSTTNSVLSGTALVAINTPLGIVNGGTMTIIDPSAATTATKALSYSVTTTSVSWVGHTLQLGNGISTDLGGAANGFELDCYTSSGRLVLGNVTVNSGSGTNRWATSSSATGNGTWIGGTFTINAGSEFRDGSATNYYVMGNIVNNGTLTNQSAVLRLIGWNLATNVEAANPNAQTISGAGLFRNAISSPTASLLSMTVNNNNATGVTLNVPISISSTLTMTSGIINTTAVNILRLGTLTASGTFSGTPSATNMVNGPFARTFAASTTGSAALTAARLFPVGRSGVYQPIWISPTTTSGGSVIFSGESLVQSGTPGDGVTNLSSTRWEAIPNTTANLTSAFIGLGDPSIVTGRQLLQASTGSGKYSGTTSATTFTTGTPPTLNTSTALLLADFTGFLAYGDLVPCVAPFDQASNFVTSQLGANGFIGSFTAATSAPTGYLIVRYQSATPTITAPTNNVLLGVGTSLGAGTVVSNNANTTFTQTGLTAGLPYTYVIYTYQNSGCFGPTYNLSSPLTALVTTCAAVTNPATALTSPTRTTTSIDISWTASTTVGATYEIDVTTDAAFTSFVPGYNALAQSGTTLSITGLTAGTTYFFRVRAVLAGCYSTNISSSNGTLCNPTTIPYTENLNGSVSCLSVLNANADANTWGIIAAPTSSPSGLTGNVARYLYNLTNPANDYLFTQGLLLTAGTSYDLSYKFSNNSTTFVERMDVRIGTAITTAAMTTIINDHPSITGAVVQTGSTTFVAPTTGTYYIAFRAYSIADQDQLFLDDISVVLTPSCTGAIAGTAASSISSSCGTTSSAIITASGYNSGVGIAYQWQKSTDNFVSDINDISGQTNPASANTGTFINGANYYRLRVTCNNTSTAFTNVLTINYSNPVLQSTTPGTRCGTGTVSLSATPNGSDQVKWYAAATGGSALFTGNNFTTPIISTTTDYFAEPVTNYGLETGLGNTTIPSSTGASAERGIVFTANSGFTLVSAQYYSPTLNVTNTVTVRLVNNTTGVQIGSSLVLPVVQGATADWFTLNLNLQIPSAGSYRLLASFSQSVNRHNTGVDYSSSTFNNLGSVGVITSGFDGSVISTSYNYFHNISVETGCPGTRSTVKATVTSPPNVGTASASPSIICEGNSSTLSLSGQDGSYDSFVWSNGAGSGLSVVVNPTVSTTYVVTVSGSGCVATTDVSVTVNPRPNIISTTATPDFLCTGGNSQLNVQPDNKVNRYSFMTNTGASLDNMTGATTVVGSSVDDAPMALSGTTPGNALALPFPITYDDVSYTFFSASPDGWINLANSSAPTVSQFTNAITSTTNIPKISVYWDDLATGTDGSVRTLTTGTAPNRIFIVSWFVTIPRNTVGAANSTFQAWIYETTNVIEFRYGTMGAQTTNTISAGLSGNTPATNFQSLTFSSNTSSTTVANDVNASVPASGRMYTFTPNVFTYNWAPSTFLNFSNISNPLASAMTSSVNYIVTVTSQNTCINTGIVTVNVEGTIVKNTADAGFNSLRSVYNCITEGGTITYDQTGMPAVSTTILTTPLNITKSVTIQGLSPASRPEITVPAAGVSIDATKTLTLQNVDVKSSGTATFTGAGDVSITGTTVGKQ